MPEPAGAQGPKHAGFPWLPLVVGLLLCTLVFFLWRTLESREEANLRSKVQAQADFLASHIEADLRSRLPALQRMARSWELRQGTAKEEFVNESLSYQADVPGFQALEWVDRDAFVRWVVPLEGNEKALDLNLAFEKSRREAMARSLATGRSAATPPVDLVQGGKGFLAFFPLVKRRQADGWILAVFRIGEWLDYSFGIKTALPVSESCRVSVLFDGVPVYTQSGWEALGGRGFDASSRVAFLDHELLLRARPTVAFMEASHTLVPLLAAVFGLLLSLFAAIIVLLFRRTLSEARSTEAARRALEGAIHDRARVELELARSFLRLDLAAKAGAMGVWSWDLATDKLAWNSQMFELFDLPTDIDPTYATWRSALHPEDREPTVALLDEAVKGQAVFKTEFRVLTAGGRVRVIRAAARVERDSAGVARHVTGLNWDITETREAEAALRASEERVRLLLDSTDEAIYGIDLEGRCTFANPACARILGYPDGQFLLGKDMHELIHHSRADGSRLPVEECRIHQAFQMGRGVHVDDEVIWRADGSSFQAEYRSSPQITNGEVRGAVVTFTDISERRRSEEKIRHLATHDALTDLPSLRLFKDRLSMALGSARRNNSRGAVMFLDLDGFKAVNDSLGHDAGDEVLREVARRLRSTLRSTDTAARMGGDEFMLIVNELKTDTTAADMARKVIESLSLPVLFKDRELRVGVSIGIVLFPGEEDVDALIKRADSAMYRVKAQGKNNFRFADEGVPGS